MRNKQKHSGISLTEILVVVSIIAILMGVSIPAAKQLAKSFESTTGVRQLINAALSNARAIAVRQQAYAGVRFQEDTNGNTYIIFIQHDPDPAPDGTGFANGFRAVTGRKPMKLPEDVTVGRFDPTLTNGLSVVFSPQGKLTIHDVRCSQGSVNDNIFNNDGSEMFAMDAQDYPSVQSIVIGSKKEPSVSTTEYISPYTGELVMEYRD